MLQLIRFPPVILIRNDCLTVLYTRKDGTEVSVSTTVPEHMTIEQVGIIDTGIPEIVMIGDRYMPRYVHPMKGNDKYVT